MADLALTGASMCKRHKCSCHCFSRIRACIFSLANAWEEDVSKIFFGLKVSKCFVYQKLSEAKLADEMLFEVSPLQRL